MDPNQPQNPIPPVSQPAVPPAPVQPQTPAPQAIPPPTAPPQQQPPAADTQHPFPPPIKEGKNWFKIVLIVSLVLIALLLAIGGVILGQTVLKAEKQEKKPIPTPTVMLPSPSPTPITLDITEAQYASETANWKVYANQNINYTFTYPNSWFIESRDSYVRVQNYNPATAENRGYDPLEDKGKYSINMNTFEATSKTLDELKIALSTIDEKAEPAFGKRIISNQKDIVVNGFPALYREVSFTESSTIPTPEVYMLNGKGIVIHIVLGLDTEGGKDSFNQFLFTFKFTNQTTIPSPTIEVYCTMDAKMCPDGSSVGRIGPNCEFAACPR